jgi:MFS transporter, DHA2 family, multidrug resistance protein
MTSLAQTAVSSVAEQPKPGPAERSPNQPVTVGERIGLLFMIIGMFMAILDIQIVASSISQIQAGLSATPDEISWVQTSYLIAEAIMIPLAAYLSRAMSTRYLFVASALSFTLASMLCATATTIEEMILFRALQGFLGGAMIPTVFAAIYQLYPIGKPGREQATVSIALVAMIAPTIGPTLGGWITTNFSWHWMFLLNVGPGLLCAVGVWSLIDLDRPDWSLLKKIDVSGLLLLAVFLGGLEYVVEEGAKNDWLHDATIRDLTLVVTIAGVAFFWRALTSANPIVNLSVFRDRNFSTGALLGFCNGVMLYGMVYLYPLYLGRVAHLSSLQIGQIMIVTGLTQMLAAPLAGRLMRALDPRLMIAIGFLMMAASCWQLHYVTPDWRGAELFWPQVLRGAGLMLSMVPINAIALGMLPPHLIKDASGLFTLLRNLGGAFGLAAINTLILTRSAEHWAVLSQSFNPNRPEVQAMVEGMGQRMTDLGVAEAEAGVARLMGRLLEQQVLTMTYADCFLAVGVLLLAATFVLPTLRRPQFSVEGGH